MVGRYTHQHRQSGSIERKTIIGATAILLVAAAIVALFVYDARQRAAIAEIDAKTFCPRGGPVAIHAVLIDRTDPLSALQIEALQQDVERWAKDVPKRAAFRMYEVGVGGTLLEPVVDVCNPGDGSDASSLDANPERLRRRYREKFLKPVNSMLGAMQGDERQAKSPIMEAIQAIAVRNFGEGGPTGENSLIVVSDLLENSDRLSLYRSVPDSEAFMKSATGRSLHSDLHGVSVSIYLINRVRDAKYQTDALGAFWVHWLTNEGGDVATFKQLPG